MKRRAAAGAAAVVLLLLAAAAAARAGGGPAAPTPSPLAFYDALEQVATVLLVGLGLLTAGVFIWALWAPPPPGRRVQGRPWMLRTILFAALLVAVAVRVRLRAVPNRTAAAALAHPAHTGGASAAATPPAGGLAGYIAGLLLLGGIVALFWWRSRRTPPRRPATAAEALQSVEAAAAELAAARDPREAVVRAYAVMERSFAGRGLARGLPEVPAEYLERLLRAFPAAGEPCRRLTALYHRARFSQHPVGAEMRSAAERELQSIRLAIQTAG